MRLKRFLATLLACALTVSATPALATSTKDQTRIYGANRYETSLAASEISEVSENIVIASGENYVDALTGGVLANSLDAILLLTPQGDLSIDIEASIIASKAKNLYIVGGTDAVSEDIEKKLGNNLEITRVSGQDRFETSVEVAKLNASESKEFVVTNGLDYPDALVVSSITSSPLLLVSNDGLAPVVKDYLKENQDKFDSFSVIGGPNSVSEDIIAEIKAASGIKDNEWTYGANRYGTAVEASKTKEDIKGVVVASGETFADALIAGNYAYKNDLALILSAKDYVPKETYDYFRELPDLNIIVIGGPESISEETQSALSYAMYSVLEHINSYQIGGETAAEIVSYNPANQSMYVINGEDVTVEELPFQLDEDGLFAEVESYSFDFQSELNSQGIDFKIGDVTSVASAPDGSLTAVSLQAEGTNDNGLVVIIDSDNKFVTSFETGAQPDMVTFTPDGKLILTADEGEPREGYAEGTVDPLGTITVYNIEEDQAKVLDFTSFDEKREELITDKVLLKPNSKVSADLEPEYIAVSADSTKAYVSLQENNAIATVDLDNLEITSVKGLGFKDHGAEGNEIDIVSDKKINIVSQPGYFGIYNPDAIDTYTVNGVDYIVTANEGDAREWGPEDTDDFYENVEKIEVEGTGEEVEVFKSDAFEGLDPDKHYLLGARSFAIFKADDMSLVYDSGSDFENITAEVFPDFFNASNSKTKIENRSDNKGPEPEGVIVFEHDERFFAFIALERIGGVMVYEITDPNNPIYFQYINTRDFSEDLAGDSGPEGLELIYPDENSYGRAYLLVSFEVSGTLGGFNINLNKFGK